MASQSQLVDRVSEYQSLVTRFSTAVKSLERIPPRKRSRAEARRKLQKTIVECVEKLKNLQKELTRYFQRQRRSAADSGNLRSQYERLREKCLKILDTDFVDEVLDTYEEIDEPDTYTQRKIKRAKKKHSNGNRSNVNLGGGSDDEQVQQQVRRKVTHVLRQKDADVINFANIIAQETHNDLLDMEAQTNEIVDMNRDILNMLDGQQDVIDSIEGNIERANEHVERGRKNIKSARDMQKLGKGVRRKAAGAVVKGGFFGLRALFGR